MDTTSASTTYAAYWLFKLDRAFARLSETERRQAKAEFLATLEGRDDSVSLRGVYSLVGLREDADLLLWVHGTDLDAIQRLAVALRHSGLGGYLETRQTYIGVVATARYDPGHLPSFMLGATPRKFISVYPFVKTTEWYLLPYERRRELMAEHGLIGRRYAVPREQLVPDAVLAQAPTVVAEGGGVLANTVDAFGLGDYEFILANESDDPSELCRMMESLRATEVRRYTQQDVPIFLGRRREPAEALEDL
ncbi:MAG TPA: chlorite dismutase family protein [Ktedonobacterales bacterium]|nr:chlorite dismutase family protein [Ktedonobacterales bacterium]